MKRIQALWFESATGISTSSIWYLVHWKTVLVSLGFTSDDGFTADGWAFQYYTTGDCTGMHFYNDRYGFLTDGSGPSDPYLNNSVMTLKFMTINCI